MIWLPALVLVLVGGLMYWRRAYRELPFFFLFVISALLLGILRYVALFAWQPNVYFYVYWITELAAAVPVALALYEIFLRRLFPSFQRVRFYRSLFPLAAVAIFLLTVITAAQSSNKRAAFVTASHGADFVRTAILVFFVALMAFMGRQWKRYDFGIALGFGLQAAVALADTAVSFRFHNPPALLTHIDVIVYDITCLIWLITFWKPEKALVKNTADNRIVEDTLRQARTLEEVLKDFTSGKR
ncbi:MAG TPA: hypothetical protein VJW20_02945 [Candidatus Angelobacter sp.]|nr:hypothetical protein [Candidatus Angelobacter sp.]